MAPRSRPATTAPDRDLANGRSTVPRAIISDDRIYGPVGAVIDIVTWLVGIGAVIILGAVAGVVSQDRPEPTPSRA
jgi:hypothetical protein